MVKNKINTFVIGSGGREATLARMLSGSKIIDQVFVGPGNGGTHAYATPVPITPDYPQCDAFIDWLKGNGIGLVVSGSETDLVKNLGNIVRANGIPFVGASGEAAHFEGDKAFATEFRNTYGIPQPKSELFTNSSGQDNLLQAKEYGEHKFASGIAGLVPKYTGLAGGKGAIVTRTLKEYLEALYELHNNHPNLKLVVEDFIPGVETSATVLVQDWKTYMMLSYSQDHKRALDGDLGLNSGGMGAVTHDLSDSLDEKIRKLIIEPTIKGAEEIGRPMNGAILYVGLIITPEGKPLVLEYNMRMGDPETQVILPRVNGDVGELLYALATGTLDKLGKQYYTPKDQHFATVVMAAKGYPGSYKESEGKPITGIEEAMDMSEVIVNIAGTTYDPATGLYTVKGSRNINVVGEGRTQEEAIRTAYRGVHLIESDGLFNRSDIGCNLHKIWELPGEGK